MQMSKFGTVDFSFHNAASEVQSMAIPDELELQAICVKTYLISCAQSCKFQQKATKKTQQNDFATASLRILISGPKRTRN